MEVEETTKPMAASPSTLVKTTQKRIYLLKTIKSEAADTSEFLEVITDKNGHRYGKRKKPFPFTEQCVTFGSDPSCNVIIKKSTVSPLHFKLVVVPLKTAPDGSMVPGVNYKIVLENLQDVPVSLNDSPVEKGSRADVVSGDIIVIQKVKFLYEERVVEKPFKRRSNIERTRTPDNQSKNKHEQEQEQKSKQEEPPQQSDEPLIKEDTLSNDPEIIPSCFVKTPALATRTLEQKIEASKCVQEQKSSSSSSSTTAATTGDVVETVNTNGNEGDKQNGGGEKSDSVSAICNDKICDNTSNNENCNDKDSKSPVQYTKSDVQQMFENEQNDKTTEGTDKHSKEKEEEKEVKSVERDDDDDAMEVEENKNDETSKKEVSSESYVLGDILGTEVPRGNEPDKASNVNVTYEDESVILNIESLSNGPDANKEPNDTEKTGKEKATDFSGITERITEAKEEVEKKTKRKREEKAKESTTTTNGKKKIADKSKIETKRKRNKPKTPDESEEEDKEEEDEQKEGREDEDGNSKNGESEDESSEEESLKQPPPPKKTKSPSAAKKKKGAPIFMNLTIILTCIQRNKSELVTQITEHKGSAQSGFLSKPKPGPITETDDGRIVWDPAKEESLTTIVVTERGTDGLLPRSCTSLMALALHIPVVDKSWVAASIKKGERQELGPYLLRVQGVRAKKFSQPLQFTTDQRGYGDLMVRDGEAATLMVTSKDKAGNRISPELHEVRELKTWEWIVETLGGRVVKPPKRHYDYELCIVFKEKCFHLSQTYGFGVDAKLKGKKRKRGEPADQVPIVGAQWVANCLVENELLPVADYTLDQKIFG